MKFNHHKRSPMNKSSLLLISIISLCNTITYSDHHHDHHHDNHHHRDQITEEARKLDLKRLETLDKEDQEDYSHSKLAWTAAVIGMAAAGAGCYNQDIKLITGGATTALLFGYAGYRVNKNENYRAKQRREEREEIQKRLNKHSHH